MKPVNFYTRQCSPILQTYLHTSQSRRIKIGIRQRIPEWSRDVPNTKRRFNVTGDTREILNAAEKFIVFFYLPPLHQEPRERPVGSAVKSTIDYSRGGSGKKAGAVRQADERGPGEQHTEERSGPLLHAWILIESSGCSTTGPSLARWHQECDRQSGIVPFSRSLRVEPPATRRTIRMYCPSFRPARLRIICSAVIWVYDARTPTPQARVNQRRVATSPTGRYLLPLFQLPWVSSFA